MNQDLIQPIKGHRAGQSPRTRRIPLAETGPEPGFPYSLRWKIVLSLSAVLLAVVGVVSAALFGFEWTFLEKESRKRVLSLAENLAVNAREPLMAEDDLTLGPMVESILTDQDVRYVFLADHRGRVVYHSDPERIGTLVDDDGFPSGEDVIRESVPIRAEGTDVGTAVVAMGKDHLHQAMNATVLGLLPPLTVALLLGFVGVLVVANHHIRRLADLEAAMQALGAGNLLINVDIRSRDELGRMGRYFNQMVEQLNLARRRSFDNYVQTISALAAAVEAKDSYTRGHCDRVARMAEAVARRVGVNESTMKDLKLAAVLHDIGKIGIGNEIIGKGGPLNESQVVDIRNHTLIGSRILEQLSSLTRVSLYVKHHHERFDGKGYPSGLKGDAIPLPSRIIHLADAYDAMTTDRPYRRALSPGEAVERLKGESGKQFDPALVNILLKLHEEGVIEEIWDSQEVPGLSQVL